MPAIRVWIACEPVLLGDVLLRLFSSLDKVIVVERLSDQVDVIVFTPKLAGPPRADWPPDLTAPIKLIALSASGDGGWLRPAGQQDWRRLRPLGIQDLCAEVRAGRQPLRAAPAH